MEHLQADAIRSVLGPVGAGVTVQCLPLVDSTNRRLKEWRRAGQIRPPYLLAADAQSAGRGRLGRTFVSPAGTGLYMSLLSALPAGTGSGRITVLAAVAVCRAIEELTELRPKIKWVNDLFVRGRKVCGILAEGLEDSVIIGIGVNVRTPPGGFPPEAGIAGALDVPLDRAQLAGRIAAHLLTGLQSPADPALLEAYRARMPLVGRTVCYTMNGQEKNARVTGVSEDGGLTVETDGGREVLRSGEITLGSQSFLGLE